MREAEMMEQRTGRKEGAGVRTVRATALAALIFVAPVIAAAAPV